MAVEYAELCSIFFREMSENFAFSLVFAHNSCYNI